VHSPGQPFATAVLVEDATIAWVGQEAGADALSPDVTVDLDGGWLAPAFVDAHVHATSTGLALTGLDLTDAPSLTEALRQVEQHCRRTRGGVVLGTGWDETRWPEGRPPTAAELDRASYGGVVYLARTDVHSAVVSSALLAACPEAAALPGYVGNGLVREQAHHAVRRVARATVTPAQRHAAQRVMLDRAASLGIACVHECAGPDISGEDDFLSLLGLEHGVERIGYWGELGAVEKARELGAVGAGGDLFVDGSIGSQTACLTGHYSDADSTGMRFLEAEQISAHLVSCTEAGLQGGFHAIGDGALQAVVDGLGRAAITVGLPAFRAARHRIEHVEMVSPEQVAVLAEHGVIASVQPAFDARWGGEEGMYVRRLGRERARAMNPFAGLTQGGVSLALGSDSPITPLDPWGAVRAAVHHQTPGSGLSPRAAFAAHTRGGWQAAHRDLEGRVQTGAPATFAVWQLSGDLVDGLPDVEAPSPVCGQTVMRGRSTYSC